MNNCISEPNLLLYCSKQLYIHINEAIKYLGQNILYFEDYIDKNIIGEDTYLSIAKEMDFSNKETINTKLIKPYRDGSVHYRDNKPFEYLGEFCKYARELNEYLPELEEDFPLHINKEVKSMMIHLNMFIIERDTEQEQYAGIVSDLAEKLIFLITHIFENLSIELEG